MSSRSHDITLPHDIRAQAEERAREDGYESIGAYLAALVEEDRLAHTADSWLKKRIEDGLASPNMGELTREKLDRLIDEGIARTQKP